MSTVTAESTREHRITLPILARRKRRGAKISMLTAYDYTFACIFDTAGIDILLVVTPSGTWSRAGRRRCP